MIHTILYPMPYHVSKTDFMNLVEQALRSVPDPFAQILEEVPIEIRDHPTPRQLKSVGLTKNERLLGLYTGTALPDRSVETGVRLPDKIYLFQREIESVCDSAEQLKEEVRKTVLHEIGHHFGLDEQDLDDLGYG